MVVVFPTPVGPIKNEPHTISVAICFVESDLIICSKYAFTIAFYILLDLIHHLSFVALLQRSNTC